MSAKFQVIATQSYTYNDQTGHLVNGYRVYFYLPAYAETHSVLVPSLAKETVQAAITRVVQDRDILATM